MIKKVGCISMFLFCFKERVGKEVNFLFKNIDKNQPKKEEKKAIRTMGSGLLHPQRRDRTDSAVELPAFDSVSVTVEEIMEKYYGKLHYEIISLGLKLVAGKINGPSMRCVSILRALIKFINDYKHGANVRIEVDFTKKLDLIKKFLQI